MAQAIIPKDFETLPISAAKVQPTFTDLSGLALLRLILWWERRRKRQ
jgi:hypothetical protein